MWGLGDRERRKVGGGGGCRVLCGEGLTIVVINNDNIQHRLPNNDVRSDGSEHDREALIFHTLVVSDIGELETDLMVNCCSSRNR